MPNGRALMRLNGTQDWPDLVGDLLHEAMEFALTNANAAYESYTAECRSTSQRMFFCPHAVYTEACVHAGRFVAAAYAPLHKAWASARRKARKRAKKKAK